MRRPIRTIVVGAARAEELDPVLASAARLAQSTGAELHVVHVVDLPDPVPARRKQEESALLETELRRHMETSHAALEEKCAHLPLPEDRLRIEVRAGSPHGVLTGYAAATGADLLVIGATSCEQPWRTALGTTVERVLQTAETPVLVLHRPFFRAVERILLTTDLSEWSAGVQERSLDVLESLCGAGGLEVRSLHVLGVSFPGTAVARVEALEEIAHGELERFMAAQRPRAYPVAARVRVGERSVEINVEADAWGVDLIVLGTRGRSDPGRRSFGSVAAATLRDAVRNVLVIPAAAEPAFESGAAATVRLDG